jgi:hypothetical protein
MNQEKAPAMPNWVKILGIIAIILVLLLGSAHLMGMGGSMMNMHMPPSHMTTEQGTEHP